MAATETPPGDAGTAAQPTDDVMTVRFAPDRLLRSIIAIWLVIEITLFVLDAFFEYGKLLPHRSLRRLFNLAREDGLGTWFASTQALLVGGVLFLIRCRLRLLGIAGRRLWAFTFLAGFFCYIAIDDAAKIHERLGTASKDLADGGGPFAWFPSYAWQVVLGPALAAAALLIVWVWWRELRSRRSRVFIAVALSCFVAAVGLDFVEGLDHAHSALAGFLGLEDYTVRHFSKTSEEVIEMFGTTMFLVGFLRHWLELTPALLVEQNPATSLSTGPHQQSQPK